MIDPIARKDKDLLATEVQKLPNPVYYFYAPPTALCLPNYGSYAKSAPNQQ